MTLVFPLIIIVLMLCAAGVYFCAGDWRHGAFWLCAAAINLTTIV